MKRGAANPNLPPPGLADRFALVVATGLGSGYAPVASGTFGTLVAIPLYLAVARLPPWMMYLSILAFVALAIWAADRAALYFGHTDDGRIVSDEVAGLLITLAGVAPSWKAVIAGFFLFRLCDIVKPWPASYFDKKVHNGIGNVMDDVFAGVWAHLGVYALLRFWP